MTISADGYCTVIASIATADAKYTIPQSSAAEFMLQTEGLSQSLRKRIPQIYERSGIDRRHTVLEDYTRTFEDFDFYPPTPTMKPAPTTGARNSIYRRESIALATQAAAQCIKQAEVPSEKITHLIVVSCTGFFAPGLDIHLVKLLGLQPDTRRTIIGFMGCYAAFNALRVADDICKSDRSAKILVVCVELCSLHFQIEDSLESVVVNALFSDGAGAVLIASCTEDGNSGKLVYRDNQCFLDDDSLDAMSWEIGDTGYIMGLSPAVPEIIASRLPGFIALLLERNHRVHEDLDFWAVHPGGRQILDKTASQMALSDNQIEDSYFVLRENGNMSSPTILYVLKRIIEKRNLSNTDQTFGVALAFGPGLTIEGCLLEFVP